MDICTDVNFLQAVVIVKYFINIALIVVPVLFIILGSVDGIKAVISGKQEEVLGIFYSLGRRAASIMIVLLLPSVLNIIFSAVEDDTNVFKEINTCYENATSETVAALKASETKTTINNTQEYVVSYSKEKIEERLKEAEEAAKKDAEDDEDSSSSSGSSLATGNGNFTKYALSDAQLNGIAYQCYREQGTPQGAAAEASLMANRFELYGSSHGSGADGLFNYVKNSGWFAGAKTNLNNTSGASQEIVAVVKAVLVDGKRTLPGYVDEHDCVDCGSYGEDITSATNNGVAIDKFDYSQYESHVTVLKNRYGATYTFYTFPFTNSDPFGYTSKEKREKLGDDCYSFNDLGI